MSLLSTLRPLSSRLYDTFSWILAYLSASSDRQTTFNDLNDDCLLLLLETLSLPQLLTLRGVSRRLCHLIEHYRLPQYKTLLFGYFSGNDHYTELDERINSGQHPSVSLYGSTRFHAFSEFDLVKRLRLCWSVSPPGKLFPVKLSTFPPSLPSILPRLASLTFTHFLVHFEKPLDEEKSTVNLLLANYLTCSWKETLVSLHLCIQVPSRPEPDPEFFGLLNKLPALRCLALEFSHLIAPNLINFEPVAAPGGVLPLPMPNYGRWVQRCLLPDTLPVLSQLTSFSLTNYGGRNTALLLGQLGPRLTYFSLWNVYLSVREYTAFFASKPTYLQTLQTVEMEPCFMLHVSREIFTLASQYLPALERLVFKNLPLDDIVTFFANLERLPNLRQLSHFTLSTGQIRAYRLLSLPGPRLATVRRLSLSLYCQETGTEESELLDYTVSLLASVFPNLHYLDIFFRKMGANGSAQYSQAESLQLASLVNHRFKGLSACNVTYSCPPVV